MLWAHSQSIILSDMQSSGRWAINESNTRSESALHALTLEPEHTQKSEQSAYVAAIRARCAVDEIRRLLRCGRYDGRDNVLALVTIEEQAGDGGRLRKRARHESGGQSK